MVSRPRNTDDLKLARARKAALLRSICVDSFADFVQHLWPVMEPTRALVPSVAIDGICAALQAVGDGRIKRLGIACPPGVSKSKAGAVAFPAWLALKTDGRERIMCGSYSNGFAERDATFCRDLIQSDAYRELVGDRWEIRQDANRIGDFWFTTGGRRMIVSPDGRSMGERCTTQIIDDALSSRDAYSDAAKRDALRWVSVMLPSRLEDQDRDRRVLIGQRLALDDPMKWAIDRGWKILVLAAIRGEDDPPGELYDDVGKLVWRDPRRPGEPLSTLLGLSALEGLRRDMGSSAFAAQYLQRPADDSTSLIRRSWWRFYRPTQLPEEAVGRTPRPAGCDEASAVVELPEHFERITIAVDLTFGSPTGDYADVTAWGAHGAGRYLVDKWRARAGFETSCVEIERIKQRWPSAKVLIEKAANGAATIETLSKRITGVVAQKPIGKKAQRLAAVAPTVESGCCYLPLGASWLGDFVEELAGATNHDDQCDTTAYALIDLNVRAASVGIGGWTGARA